MAKEPKIIDQDTKLRAYALFMMAHTKQREAREFEYQLGKLLGYPVDNDNYLGCLSDEIYDGGKFDAGLEREGFAVKVAAPRKRSKR